MTTMTSYLENIPGTACKTLISDLAQTFQLDTTFKPFGPARDIFDP